MLNEFVVFLLSGALGRGKACSIKTGVIKNYIPECVTTTGESKNIARPVLNLHIGVLNGRVPYDQNIDKGRQSCPRARYDIMLFEKLGMRLMYFSSLTVQLLKLREVMRQDEPQRQCHCVNITALYQPPKYSR